ncbi:lamin tail domain-containing protein [Candidatus Pacearchaeota archaeon]|nr:lamin tail domain-containing protein [Candidatus Pacearchaeota archaeon]
MKFSSVILLVFLFTIILTDNVSSLRINEIESNPEGEDSGFEWIEFYSETEVSLEGYILDHEGRGDSINLSGSFLGFFVLTFQTQWLRNTNETVYLKYGEQIIQTIGPFSDNKVEKTYNFCNDQWKFDIETKNEQNSCDGSPSSTQSSTNNNNQIEVQDESDKEDVFNNTIISSDKIVYEKEVKNKIEKISLSKKGETQEITKTYKTRIGVIYFFIGFCVFLVILIALRKL